MRNPLFFIGLAILGLVLLASQSDARRGEKPCVGPNCPTCPRVDVDTPRVRVRVNPVRIDNDCDQLSEREKRGVIAYNDWRAERGKAPLPVDDTLQRIARKRAPYFNHKAFGISVWTHANRYGFKGTCTDNLAKGQHDGPEAVRSWASEPSVGHREQMLGLRNMNGRWEDFDANCCAYAQHGNKHILIIGHQDLEKSLTQTTLQREIKRGATCPNCRRN